MRSNSYLVRHAEETDLGAITRIYTHYVLNGAATFELDPPDLVTMQQRRAGILALGLPFLVAESHGTVLGYAYASLYRPRPAYRFTIEDSIYVDAEYTGRGCGRALLSALIDICSKGSWRQMIAGIGDSANVRSVHLHEGFGFQHVGTLQAVGFKFEKWVDTVLMQKSLGV